MLVSEFCPRALTVTNLRDTAGVIGSMTVLQVESDRGANTRLTYMRE